MARRHYPKEFLKKAKAIRSKRPRIVIRHILKHGFITTEDLEKKYGYTHPPRAARDVREEGIPLETFRTKNSKGRSIGAYRFADISKIRYDKLGGRKIISKKFKGKLLKKFDSTCQICLNIYEGRYLQVDHRIPYELIGDYGRTKRKIEEYMILCGSCNRAKSWSCEHCENWNTEKLLKICTARATTF